MYELIGTYSYIVPEFLWMIVVTGTDSTNSIIRL